MKHSLFFFLAFIVILFFPKNSLAQEFLDNLNLSASNISHSEVPDTTLTLTKQISLTTTFIINHNFSRSGRNKTGTGFFFNFKIGEKTFPAIITNKHVVAGPDSISFEIKTGDQRNYHSLRSKRIKLDRNFINQRIINHPTKEVDLCAIFIGDINIENITGTLCNVFFDESNIIPESVIPNIEALSSIFMAGHPNSFVDSKHGLPVIRSGSIASPMSVDWNSEPIFVTDLETVGGSSGSPVYLHDESYSDGTSFVFGTRFFLAGIAYAVNTTVINGETEPIIINGAHRGLRTYSRSPNGLGLCVKAREILKIKLILEEFILAESPPLAPAENDIRN